MELRFKSTERDCRTLALSLQDVAAGRGGLGLEPLNQPIHSFIHSIAQPHTHSFIHLNVSHGPGTTSHAGDGMNRTDRVLSLWLHSHGTGDTSVSKTLTEALSPAAGPGEGSLAGRVWGFPRGGVSPGKARRLGLQPRSNLIAVYS